MLYDWPTAGAQCLIAVYAGQAPFDHPPRSLSQTQPVAQIPTSAQYGAFAIEMHAFEQFAGVPPACQSGCPTPANSLRLTHLSSHLCKNLFFGPVVAVEQQDH